MDLWNYEENGRQTAVYNSSPGVFGTFVGTKVQYSIHSGIIFSEKYFLPYNHDFN